MSLNLYSSNKSAMEKAQKRGINMRCGAQYTNLDNSMVRRNYI
jgi:hypothetical protein